MEKRKTIELEEEELLSSDAGLTLSEIKVNRKYMVDISFFSDKKFVGDVIPVPAVLIKYLNATELRVFIIILEQLKNHEVCMWRRSTFASALGVSLVTITTVLSSLESMGILSQVYIGNKKGKKINFDTIQKLNDILKDRLPGAERAFRKAMEDCDIRDPKETAMALLDIQYTQKYGFDAEEYD